MRALQFSEFGSVANLRLIELPDPKADSATAIVKIAAGAISPSDVKNVEGKMEHTTLPRVPGRDYAGNAPMNFINVFPSVTVQPWRNFAVKVGMDVLWRYSVQDAFYQPPGVPFVPGSANTKRFLGAQSVLQFEWQATPHISVNAIYVHFLTKGFLKAAGAKDIDFVGFWTSYNF
jgi:hypothetical protein